MPSYAILEKSRRPGNLDNLKYLSLVLLVAQTTLLVLMMRYSLVAEGPKYLHSSAVACMELVKLLTCSIVVFWGLKCSTFKFKKVIDMHVIKRPKEMIKLAVPSLLYTIQNNLLYFALAKLDAATYQVSYQLKILTTALFSVILLKKQLSQLQWVSLLLLAVGVGLTQISPSVSKDVQTSPGDQLMGLVAVLLACCTSGFSGVYFEKILKGSTTSIWIRNIQMGITSTVLAFTMAISKNYIAIWENGFFHGFSSSVIIVVLLQALGGLIVAVVMKYADNILKGFGNGLSIITSCLLSMFFFGFEPTGHFIWGALLVIISVYLYAKKSFGKSKYSAIP